MINIFFKTKFKHDISFIQDQSFQSWKIDISSFDMIFDPSSGSNEKIDASLQLVGLIHHADSTIDSHDSKLIFMMLKFRQFISDLYR